MKKLIFIAVLSVTGIHVVTASDTPYAGQENREIKALSDQEIEDYLNGNGMGYAKAAELNYFPGPSHVLDLSHELGLTHEQTKQTRAIFDTMKQEAAHFGTLLIEKEKELDRKFVDESIDEQTLNELVAAIGVLESKIRQSHLQAHLEQRKLLNKRQILRYAELQGYTGARESKRNHAH